MLLAFWQVLQVLEGHTDRVCAVAISADGTKIASGSFDETVRIWSEETGEVRACLLLMAFLPRSVLMVLGGWE